MMVFDSVKDYEKWKEGQEKKAPKTTKRNTPKAEGKTQKAD